METRHAEAAVDKLRKVAMAQPRCHMPHIVHRAVVAIDRANTQADDAHAQIFAIVGPHGLPKRPTNTILAVRTDAHRVIDARERGWIKVGVVALANSPVWLVEFEHAHGMIRTGKGKARYTRLSGGFKHIVCGDNRD